jgi:thiol-disulfide isomerase/thioredoxin
MSDFSGFLPFQRDMHLPAVLFVKADWCPHCHTMAPHMKRVQTILKNTMPVYAVDADRNQNAVRSLGVQGFPTVIVVGLDKRKREYDGPRDAKTIAAFARQFA